MPNNTGQFAERVAALRARLDASQQRLAGVAQMQNGLLEGLARTELEEQKERIGTYQIQARFALASIYDRAALGGGAVAAPKEGATESQGELEVVPETQAPLDGAPPAPEQRPDVPPSNEAEQTPAPAPSDEAAPTQQPAPSNQSAPRELPQVPPDSLEPGVNTSAPPPQGVTR
jgi:hypothetical protein